MNITSANQTNSTASPNSSASPDVESWEQFVMAVIAFQICIICISIAGNLLVCTAISLTHRLRDSTTNYFLISLAVSDILTAAFPMSFEVHYFLRNFNWNLGAPACRFYTTMYLIAAPSSVLNLLAVSIDRYRAISRPLLYVQNMTPRKALLIIFLIWTYVVVFALIPLMGWNFHVNVIQDGHCMFDITPYYSVLSSVINFLIPMIIMSVTYFLIYRIAHKHAKRIGRRETNFSSSGMKLETSALTNDRKNIRRSIKAAKTIAIIVSAFYLSWLPHTVYSIVGIICRSCPQHVPKLSYIFLLIAYANSAMNPFLYAFYNRDFREAFKKLLKFKRNFRH